ncbi:MAG TPA: HlyD family efflux transporter periplasmic adaptor subunit [Puia sp.]|nr:HlyD family efflux transporter periplasmic adaptor subunit [Puia sp.]
MPRLSLIILVFAILPGPGCHSGDKGFDAEGVFEADEVIVSSEVPGKILELNLDEGSVLKKDSLVAVIDSVPLVLQRSQVEATIDALGQRTLDVRPQVKMLEAQMAAQQAQLADLEMEKGRTERLIRSGAAPAKQLDDYNAQIAVLRKQIDATEEQISVQRTTVGTQNSTVWSEYRPLRRSAAQIQDQVNRTCVYNPTGGTVLAKYAMAGEVTAAGKALYKIADLSVITLRIYVTGTQLAALRIGQRVRVFIDEGPKNYREYPGQIILIADKAEFTPKTIQTKEERANLVYAVKVHVRNDGLLKIGMYGQVKFN